MNMGRVGEERGGKETDGCPLTVPLHQSDLNGTGRAADTSGQVRMTLRYPLPSCGHPFMGGLVIGGLVL
jgi:hypothetical protein